jgi:hypothetical protein
LRDIRGKCFALALFGAFWGRKGMRFRDSSSLAEKNFEEIRKIEKNVPSVCAGNEGKKDFVDKGQT